MADSDLKGVVADDAVGQTRPDKSDFVTMTLSRFDECLQMSEALPPVGSTSPSTRD